MESTENFLNKHTLLVHLGTALHPLITSCLKKVVRRRFTNLYQNDLTAELLYLHTSLFKPTSSLTLLHYLKSIFPITRYTSTCSVQTPQKTDSAQLSSKMAASKPCAYKACHSSHHWEKQQSVSPSGLWPRLVTCFDQQNAMEAMLCQFQAQDLPGLAAPTSLLETSYHFARKLKLHLPNNEGYLEERDHRQENQPSVLATSPSPPPADCSHR